MIDTTYEEFKSAIRHLLEASDSPLTWSAIKSRAGFSQKVPNNKWVRRMESEIGLVRERHRDGTITWRLGK